MPSPPAGPCGPRCLYLRDESNSMWGDYSSTEIWLMLRKSF